jgi:sugar lactone lactonase YvrE
MSCHLFSRRRLGDVADINLSTLDLLYAFTRHGRSLASRLSVLHNAGDGRKMRKIARLLTPCAALSLLLFLPSFAGRPKLTEISINGPYQLAFDPQGNLYVAEYHGHRILKINFAASSVKVIAGNGKECCFREGGAARSVSIYDVESMAVDSKDDVYFGGLNARDGAFIRKVDSATGKITTVAGHPSPATQVTPGGVPVLQADVLEPKGIVVTKSGSLIVSIDGSYLLAELANGEAKRIAGLGRKGFSGDGGLAATATFDLAGFLAADASGDLYIADYFNHRIRRIDAQSHIVTTVVGNGSPISSGNNGPAVDAGVVYPFGITLDSKGNLYVIENGTGTIRRVDRKTGYIHVIAGTGQPGFSGDGGPATLARIAPAAIALDSSDNLYFSDIANNRIRKIDTRTGIITTVAGNGFPRRKIVIE